MSDLPEGWTTCLLGSVAEIKLGKMLDKAKNEGPLRSYLRNVNVRWFGFDLSDLAQMRMSDVEAKLFDVRDDDVLVCEGGEPGRGAVWNLGDRQLTYQKALHRVRVQPALLPKMLVWQLRLDSLSFKLDRYFTGSTIKHFPLIALQRYPVSVPPLAEQKRIADKLDTVLTRVDAVSARLARVAPILKRFRQSVLAAATSGRLTEDWRDQSNVLGPSIFELGDLVASIDQGWSPKCESNAAPAERWAVIKTTAIQPLSFHPEENKALPNSLDPRPRLALEDGDVLITRAGPRSRAGIACLVKGAYPRLMLCDKAYRMRVDRSKIHPQMLNLLLNSPEVLEAIDGMKTGISESGVNLTQVRFRELVLSVPHIDEQAEIVRRVEVLFAFADRLEARLKAAQTAAERLTPALLAKAFRGELVPQDPNDEPASELLRRLQAASEHRAPARAAGRGRKRSI